MRGRRCAGRDAFYFLLLPKVSATITKGEQAMKVTQLHPVSVLCGAVGVGALFITMGMAQGSRWDKRAILVEVAPKPSSLVTIREGEPFTVPQGKALVVKTLAAAGFADAMDLKVNGQIVLSTFPGMGPFPFELQLGVSAREGDVVTVEQNTAFPQPGSKALAFGFLGN